MWTCDFDSHGIDFEESKMLTLKNRLKFACNCVRRLVLRKEIITAWILSYFGFGRRYFIVCNSNWFEICLYVNREIREEPFRIVRF